MKRLFLLLTILFSVIFLDTATAQEDWQSEAAARIEQHRKENATITVLQNGKPVDGVTIEVQLLQHEFLFGCNIFKWGRCNTPAENEEYNRRFADLFNFATHGFYWWSYENEKDKPQYSYTDQVAVWCQANSVRLKGHPLAWNYADPSWAKNIDDEELYHRQLNRITTNVDRFRSKIETWDVINEVVHWNRESCWKDSPRLSALMKQHEPIEYTKTCFLTARKANPSATLLINDYETGEKYAELIEKIVDTNGKPLYDAIGIQSHMHSGIWNNKQIWETCERFTKFGMPLHFTELTILSATKKFDWNHQENLETTEEGEQKQQEEVIRIYTMLFSHPAVEAIIWWDFSDQGAWMNVPAGLLRKNMTPKPAYDSLRKLIKETWTTNETLKTNGTGTAGFRAFRGNYRFSITFPDGTTQNVFDNISKEKHNIRIML
jgi:GH35 family endo-1,4-beta-xylanase